MLNSNVIAASNVYISTTNDPRQDKNFVEQIQDYERLQEIQKASMMCLCNAEFTPKQYKIMEQEERCIYAKNDPCFGYVNELKHIVCKCINEECPKIKECNSSFKRQDVSDWKVNKEEKDLYGDPSKLRKYYLVDLISNEEMNRYEVTPENAGKNFATQPRPQTVSNNKIKKEKKVEARIDPVTKKPQVVIGREWRITDPETFENEELFPIWGNVDEFFENEKKNIPRKKTQISRKKALEKSADVENIDSEINLQELVKICKGIRTVDIILENTAELSSISAMLLAHDIDHGYDEDDKVRLIVNDEIIGQKKHSVGVISSRLSNIDFDRQEGKESNWITAYEKLYKLNYAERQYYCFTNGPLINRWCCRNMYEITHICIENADIEELDLNENVDANFSVYLKLDDGIYSIVNENNCKIIGKMNLWFSVIINCMLQATEIPALPQIINGINFRTHDGKLNILGIGNLAISRDD